MSASIGILILVQVYTAMYLIGINVADGDGIRSNDEQRYKFGRTTL